MKIELEFIDGSKIAVVPKVDIDVKERTMRFTLTDEELEAITVAMMTKGQAKWRVVHGEEGGDARS